MKRKCWVGCRILSKMILLFIKRWNQSEPRSAQQNAQPSRAFGHLLCIAWRASSIASSYLTSINHFSTNTYNTLFQIVDPKVEGSSPFVLVSPRSCLPPYHSIPDEFQAPHAVYVIARSEATWQSQLHAHYVHQERHGATPNKKRQPHRCPWVSASASINPASKA